MWKWVHHFQDTVRLDIPAGIAVQGSRQFSKVGFILSASDGPVASGPCVRRYRCLLLRGLSGTVISSHPCSIKGLRTWSRNWGGLLPTTCINSPIEHLSSDSSERCRPSLDLVPTWSPPDPDLAPSWCTASAFSRLKATTTQCSVASNTGSDTPYPRQRSRMRRIPDPMCSTASIRCSIPNSSGLRGTLRVSSSASVMPAGNSPGLTISSRSANR